MNDIQWDDFVGVEYAQRAIEVALAGKHTIRFAGPPLSQAQDLALYVGGPFARYRMPCPCGFYGDPMVVCTCSIDEINAYRKWAFGPEVWYDIEIDVPRVGWYKVLDHLKRRDEGSPGTEEAMLERIADIKSAEEVSEELDDVCTSLLRAAFMQLHMTLFQVRRTLAVAHTIARLSHADAIRTAHLAEAIQYWRPRDA